VRLFLEIHKSENMKKSLLLKSFFSFLALVFVTVGLNAQLVLYEGFDYTIPGYVGGNGAAGTSSNNWTTHSVTTGQTTTIDLASGNLSYTGLPASVGNKVSFFSNGNATSRDINRAITTSSTTIYLSALVNVIDNSQISASTPDYFMCIGATSGTAVTILGARLGIKSVNTALNYRLSICNTSGTGTSYTEFPQDLNFGTTYLIVIKYDRLSSPTVATLWINPATLGGSEPTGSISNSSSASTFSAFASMCLRNTATTPKAEIDEIRVGETYASVTPGADVTAPVAAFYPLNNSVDVLINAVPTITFDEGIFKTDGSAVTDADLASLVTFKKTNGSGSDVPFTATINTAKKVITITPSASLDNSQLYYLAVGAVKDASGNQSTASNVTFTTIAAATPTVTLTYPAGGETFYAGDPVTFTWTSANVTTVNVEVYVPDNITRIYSWVPIITGATASAGKYDYIIPTDAHYGTQYQIRLSDAANSSVNSTSTPFTMIGYASSLTDLRAHNIVNDIVRLGGEVTITFKKVTGNSKYIQDASAGILIYDLAGVLTTPLNIGDNFKGLEGKIATYGGVKELIPTKATVTVTTTGNTVAAPEMTLTDYNTNYAAYESMLIKLTDVTFPDATVGMTFAPSTNYNLSDGTTTVTFRTFAYIDSIYSDIVKLKQAVPTSHIKMTCIAGFYTSTTTTVQVYSRTLSDFEILTAAEKVSASVPVFYPVPAREMLTVRNISNIRHAEILDASGRVIRSVNISGENEINIPVSDLARGFYFLRLTTPNGKVTSKFIK
jgi:hypothetical protein